MASAEEETLRHAQARVGTFLRGTYRVDSILRMGRIAVVYRVTHRNQQPYALKMLHSALNAHEEVRARFLSDGYAANAVKHPGAVPVLDHGVAEDGAAFLVTELLDGELVEAFWARSGYRLDARVALSIADQLLDVLATAHASGIAHGDIQPATLWALPDGTLKLLDFGMTSVRNAAAKQTGAGNGYETPAFLAPERAYAYSGDGARAGAYPALDGLVDIWAVGATLFALLTGRLVHEGPTAAEVMTLAATKRAPPLSSVVGDLPPPLTEVVDRALAFERTSRWQNAQAMKQAVEHASFTLFGAPPQKQGLSTREVAPHRVAVSPVAKSNQDPALPSTGAAQTAPPIATASVAKAPKKKGRISPIVAISAVIGTMVAGFVNRGAFSATTGCKVGDTADCAPRCEKNDWVACNNLGVAYEKGIGVSKDAAHASTFYKQACDAGEPLGCLNLGALYQNGIGVSKDPAQAAVLDKKACDGGQKGACTNLGILYENGFGVPKDKARAAALYEQACVGTEVSGCADLGALYQSGSGVVQDKARAVALYKQACDLKNAQGCYNLGVTFSDGLGVAKDKARAAAFYQQACDASYADACANLGLLYDDGAGVEKSASRAATLYQQACDAGSPRGCSLLGTEYAGGVPPSIPKDPVRAAALYKQACDAGSALGCTNLGVSCELGSGIDKDPARAARLYEQACNAGAGLGCTLLGALLANGTGVTKDPVRALALYKQACDAGTASGCTNLGVAYQSGTGVVKDAARAVAYYQQACDAGSALGCSDLGTMYGNGTGVTKSPDRAFALYQQGCNAGAALSCFNLGVTYENGAGVAKDLVRAAALYTGACEGGQAAACARAKLLAARH